MAKIFKNDLTIVYYTANAAPEKFAEVIRDNLKKAADKIPIIWVSKQPLQLHNNIVVDTNRSHIDIYKDALTGVKAAKTKYVALAEDDVLYSPEHFKRRPFSESNFAYNMSNWNIYTWDEPIYSHKAGGRKNLHSLICTRDVFIEAMEERFAKYPNGHPDHSIWAEPGKYERHLGVTQRETEEFYTNPPNIVFSHQTALGFRSLGSRKRLGEFRAYDIPYWGHVKDIRSLYDENL